MNNKTSYHIETQKFSSTLLWSVLSALLLLSPFLPLRSYYYFSSINVKDLIPLLITLTVILFFTVAKLETCIDEEGIRYRFFPLQRTFRFIRKEDIKKIAVERYDPLSDYGGRGIRFGQKGWAYNVRGNIGIAVEMHSGKRILLGSQRNEEELKAIVDKYHL